MEKNLNQTMLRQVLYRFFGSLFLYPDEELLSDIQNGTKEILNNDDLWKDQVIAEKLMALTMFLESINRECRKTIVDEYNRLFLVKPKAPPYESSYIKLSGQSEGMIAAEISGIYGQAGLIVDPETNELPDHIAVELEFMSFLCEKEKIALQDGYQEGVITVQKQQQKFVDEHLACWYPKFAKQTLLETKKSLYEILTLTTFVFLKNELEYLEIKDLVMVS